MANVRKEVFDYLMTMGSDIAPVKLSIGATGKSGGVDHGVIVVHSAPPKVVSDLVQRFVYVSVQDDGLHVPVMES